MTEFSPENSSLHTKILVEEPVFSSELGELSCAVLKLI